MDVYAEVYDLLRSGRLDGTALAAVCLITGLTATEIADLGGLD